MPWLIREEILAARLGRDIAFADIGAQRSGQAFAIAARRQQAIEIDRRLRRDHARLAVDADRHAIDIFKAARAVREEALPRQLVGAESDSAFLFPRLAVLLQRDIG